MNEKSSEREFIQPALFSSVRPVSTNDQLKKMMMRQTNGQCIVPSAQCSAEEEEEADHDV